MPTSHQVEKNIFKISYLTNDILPITNQPIVCEFEGFNHVTSQIEKDASRGAGPTSRGADLARKFKRANHKCEFIPPPLKKHQKSNSHLLTVDRFSQRVLWPRYNIQVIDLISVFIGPVSLNLSVYFCFRRTAPDCLSGEMGNLMSSRPTPIEDDEDPLAPHPPATVKRVSTLHLTR
jgi:hypothetical protein